MELLYLTGKAGADPKRCGRVLVDTNVAAPALRWIALGSGRPSQEVVDAFKWMQSRATSARVNSVDLRLGLEWAVHETSRHHGTVDGERVAQIHAAHGVLHEWLWGLAPISRLFEGDPPRVRASRRVREIAGGVQDNPVVKAESVALIHLSRLHRRRQSGELRGPKQRLEALREWSEAIASLEMLSADLILIAIQTAFGGDGAPARAMCKFIKYVDRRSARAAAGNAAWDLQFLRLMRASEAGIGPYAGPGRATTLLTFDRHLGAAAEDLDYMQRVDGPVGNTVVTKVSFRQHLQRDLLSDQNMLARLDAWCEDMYKLQARRWGRPPPVDAAQIDALLEEALESTFP